ncbi:sensor histidine kinase [Pseudomonas corrugata]
MSDDRDRNETEVRSALISALGASELDYGKVLELAHLLSKEDKDNIRFSVDAGHVSRLGLELVSKQETAIAELIKNAYDADATDVTVTFIASDTPGGILEVVDTGSGMSREQLLQGFMRISTVDKVSEPRSPLYDRQRAGRKGIGRFAAQRLGRRLSIATQQKGVDYSLLLVIDWDTFLTGIDLHMVANQVRVEPPLDFSGTKLTIHSLRDSWSEAQIRRAYRFVSDLLQPFPLKAKSPKVLSGTVDPGFDVNFYRDDGARNVLIASQEQNIVSNAVGHITAWVEPGGKAYVSLSSDKFSVDYDRVELTIDQKSRARGTEKVLDYKLLDGVYLSAHYFIQDELPGGTRGMVRDVLNRTGGVRVYRNGFRVLPYGETFDDWLTLQRSSALRELLPPHHNTNFLGFVELEDVLGERFQETASREGLIENDAFHQLQDFVYRALVAGVVEIARARKRKLFAKDKKIEGRNAEGVAQDVRTQAAQVAEQLRTLAESATPNSQDNQKTLDFTNDDSTTQSTESDDAALKLNSLAEQVEAIGNASQSVLEEVGMLRVLASLGLTIGEFTHEVRHALAALGAVIETVNSDALPDGAANELSSHVILLREYMRYFDTAVTQNAHRKLEAHELRDIVSEFVSVVRPTFARQGVEVITRFQGYDLFTRPMHKSELASTFLNLFTNALKAIHRAGVSGKILISCSFLEDYLQIDFSDNGDGIPVENRERIFEPFFTTSTPPSSSASHDEQLVGTGLGLKIVRDILESAGGDIEVSDPESGYSTCIRITIPRAREDQIDDEQY